MSIFEIISVIFVACLGVACIIVAVLQESDDKQKTGETPEEKIETVLTKLFSDNTSLNNDALEAYKALIQESFNASQKQKQDKPWR
jgi:hypothetical protein